jgi:uncharacterized protein
MKTLNDVTLACNTGGAFEVLAGQVLRLEGRTTADVVFFDLHNLRERFCQARTKVLQGKIFVTQGDILYSKSNNPMMRITEDSLGLGEHDIEFGMCSASSYARYRGDLYEVYEVKKRFGIERDQVPAHGCWENLSAALEPWGIPPEDIPSPFNAFQETRIDGATGRMDMVLKDLVEPARIEMLAEMDCLVGVSACPWVGKGQPIRVSVWDRG